MEMTTGFFLLSRFIWRQISSDAVTSPPGESMRTTTPFTRESFSTRRRSLLKPYEVRLFSPAPSSPGLPRSMSPSPTTSAMWLLPCSPRDSAVTLEYLSMETRAGDPQGYAETGCDAVNHGVGAETHRGEPACSDRQPARRWQRSHQAARGLARNVLSLRRRPAQYLDSRPARRRQILGRPACHQIPVHHGNVWV